MICKHSPENTYPRKALATYFALAYFLSWTLWLPLYGPVLGFENFPVLPFQHGLGGLGPCMASFMTTWLFGGWQGVKKLAARCLKVKPLLYLFIALFGPFMLTLMATAISYFIAKEPINLSGLLQYTEFPGFGLPSFFLYNLLFFGFGEEAGWRGFALPGIQKKFGALSSSIILTGFWALWHWPLFLYRPALSSMPITGVFGWALSLLTGSILLTWLYNSTRGSVLICAVFHATMDIPFTADLAATGRVTNYLGMLITLWGLMTIIVFKPANLSTHHRIENI